MSDDAPRRGGGSLSDVLARLEREGKIGPLPPVSETAHAPLPPPVFGPAAPGDLIPGHQRLTYGALEKWERERAAVAAENRLRLAASVAAQKAEIAAERRIVLARATARQKAEEAPTATKILSSERPDVLGGRGSLQPYKEL